MGRIVAADPLSASLSTVARALRTEIGPMFALAWPVAAAELGWMAMGLVDTMLVGRVGAEAIGAVSIGSHLFFAVAITGIGMLLGLDYLVATAFGAGRADDGRRALVQGLHLAVLVSAVLTAVLFVVEANLDRLGLQPNVAVATRPYLRTLIWSLLPLLLFAALRRYLQAIGCVRPVMVALVSANVINAVTGWLLVFGNWGAPALGAVGAGWATCASRVYMLAFLVVTVWRLERRAGGGAPLRWAPDRVLLGRLARLGLPAATQMLLECGVFATATVLAGSLTASALAAHQIALSAAAFTFMVPLGVSAAAAVRVGHAVGRRQPAAARRAGWAALLLGAAFMSASAVVFVSAPRLVLRVFTDAPEVIAIGITLLGVAAAFQLFDGLQVVATGVLRGVGDTRTPMLANLAGHWLIGLPIGVALCFRVGWGVAGLWIGLCAGLIAVALTLISVWARRRV
ncbi:MATE family efflux transporter [bacterium]|nr:MATE family efflux transporter [bacterium]